MTVTKPSVELMINSRALTPELTAGLVVGALAVLGVIIGCVVMYVWWRRHRAQEQVTQHKS